MKPKPKTTSTPHASETALLAKLINENVRLRVQLKLAHKDLENVNAKATKLREDLYYMKYPTLNWPQGLSFRQKLNQFSALMGGILKDENSDPFLRAALRKLIAECKSEFATHSETRLMALEAHWMFPVVAYGLSKRENPAEATTNGLKTLHGEGLAEDFDLNKPLADSSTKKSDKADNKAEKASAKTA